jgi:predicted RNA-binding protein with PIN domain
VLEHVRERLLDDSIRRQLEGRGDRPGRPVDVERDIDAARERLIADLGVRAAAGQDVTVVFDGGGNPASEGEPLSVGGGTVVFSPAGSDADAVIEALAARARAEGVETEIVTSDNDTRWTSMGGPVTVTRSITFAGDLASDDESWRERHEAPRGRGVIADRLDGATRAKLDRMAGRRDRPSS